MKKIIAIMSILLMLLTSISIAFAEEATTDATTEATATETTATEPTTTETATETSTTDVSETATEEVSVTPDSPLWGVKLAIERIDLALTFNRAAKSEKGLKYARLRLLEVEKMMKKGDFKNAGKAEEARAKLIAKTRKHLDEEKAKEGETTKVKDLESRLQRHIEVLEAVKAKLEAKGVPTQGIENALAIAKAKAECRLEVEQLVNKRKAGEAVEEGAIAKVKAECREDIKDLISERKELIKEKREEIKERKGKVLEEKESEEVETEEESETEEVEETETVETTEETTPAQTSTGY